MVMVAPHVDQLAGLRVDAGRGIRHDGPALQKLLLDFDAEARLREVVRRDEEPGIVAVAVDQ